MKPLEPPASFFVLAAQGWLELGCPREAALELAELPEEHQDHPEVLNARWQIAARQKEWGNCLASAEALMAAAPDEASGWIHRSYALHELKRTQEAWDALLPAAERFKNEPVIAYNLACYACQMRRLDEAWEWLERAAKLGDRKAIKTMAGKDPDLAPLREAIARL